MAALEIATFWGGELLFLDYRKHAPDVPLGWTYEGAVAVHARWVPDAERLGRKGAPWGEMAFALVVAIVLHVGLLGLGLWIHDAEDPFDMPPNVFTLGTLGGNPELAGSGEQGTQEPSVIATPTAAPEIHMGRTHVELADPVDDEPSQFGMLGLLAGIGSDEVPKDWGASGAGGVGDLFGRDVPALGPELLSGVGQGGGGRGQGIGLGSIGGFGICDDGCAGAYSLAGHGRGHGIGLGRGHHATVVCRLPMMSATASKRLPAEVIQRIVRQNAGRFRGCYEDGLAKNPSLAGRVAVKFMIARDGSVSMAEDAGSTFPDPSVIACIVRAYQTISFPESDSAIGVTYPLELSPSD